MKISLTDDLREFINRNSGDGTLYVTPGEFVRDILRREKERRECGEIRRAILEGYEDGIQGRNVVYDGDLRALLRRDG